MLVAILPLLAIAVAGLSFSSGWATASDVPRLLVKSEWAWLLSDRDSILELFASEWDCGWDEGWSRLGVVVLVGRFLAEEEREEEERGG